MNNIIQVAGIRSPQEADMLVECGVDYLGFPFRLDYHSEDISEAEAAKIISQLPESVKAVVITYLNQAEEISDLMKILGASVVQLHGVISIEEITKLKSEMPEIRIIKSLIIGRDPFSVLLDWVGEFAAVIDAFITDTYDPLTGASGATGRTHDWEISRKIVRISPKPVILAGGLAPENVKEAILKVKPAGVDVHTGIENSEGYKDKDRVVKFVSEAREAFNIPFV
jgi:phosphoribosylanthranilate isomerase